jgi:LuxR family maltose regulon positive regulatory protein
MNELLSTKLYIPRPWSSLVSRPRLTEKLNAGLDRKLTLISAPAGFGKTTLLSEWIPQSQRCVTWFSLDEGDNDPTRFWTYVISSWQQINPGLGRGALALLQSPQAPPIKAILTTLINAIAAFPDRFATVLDDYHVIDSQPINETLAFLIDHSPDNFHLIITTRVDPDLPLARLRARDQMVEFRANDLRFTMEESAVFLTQVMGLDLTAEEVATLETRTEGWIAGLQLAALTMQSREDTPRFIQAFSGSHRHILGFLAEEVLNQRPKGTLDFLLRTSILDRLCGPLCDAVTGDTGGQRILEKLERANLFITPLDDDGVWYRYHHLFSEVLQLRLQQTQPDLISNLHRRASEWYEQNGRLSEAVSHALAAQDFHLASRLIEESSRAMWQRGEVTTLRNWLAALPPGIRHTRPKLCLAQAWGALAVGQIDIVDSSIREAEKAIRLLYEAEAKPLRAQVDAIQSTLAGFRQDSAKAIELAHRSLEHLPEMDHFLRGLLTYNLGRVYLSQGDLPTASKKLREAATLSLSAGDLSTASFALNALGAELEAQGRLCEAASCYREVIQAIQEGGRLLPVTAASGAYVWLGRILYEWNQLDESIQCANQGIELSRPFQAHGALFVGYLVLVNVLKAHGDLTGATNALGNAETAVRSGTIPQAALRMVEAVRAQIWLAQRDIEKAVQWAIMYEHDLDFPVSGDWPDMRQLSPMYDYEYLTLVRVRMAQCQWDEALTLLTRLQPVVEAGARKAGLIELLALRALALQMQTNSVESIAALEIALNLAEPEGYIRTFVDYGEPMYLLLLDYQSIIKEKIGGGADGEFHRLLKYTERLVAAFSKSTLHEKSMREVMLEPLSEREMEILRLIAAGQSNKEIAEILVIAVSTVKSHINNLYAKFGVHSRTQAIAIARDLGLFPD